MISGLAPGGQRGLDSLRVGVTWLSLAVGLAASASAQRAPDQLVRYWAPVLVQDLSEDVDHRSDYLTSLDFDQNWRLENNNSNALAYSMPAVVYSWWHRTERYVLLGYSFYRVEGAGGSDNDLRSAVALIEAPTEERPLGRFVALAVQNGGQWSFSGEAEADSVRRNREEGSRLRRERRQVSAPQKGRKPRGKGRSGGVDGHSPLGLDWRSFSSLIIDQRGTPRSVEDVDFVRTRDGLHPVIYGALGTHDLSTDVAVDSRPALFTVNGVTDWTRLRPMTEIKGRGHSVYPSGKASNYMPLAFGLVYAPGTVESVVAPAGQRARGKLSHHWEVFSYGLRSLEELWNLRSAEPDQTPPVSVFSNAGFLVGRGERGPGSLPPWLQLETRTNQAGEESSVVQPSLVFFYGTVAFSDYFDVPEEPILDSSLGSAAALADVAAGYRQR